MYLPTLDMIVTQKETGSVTGYVGPFHYNGPRLFFWMPRNGTPTVSLFIGSGIVGTVNVA